MYSHLQIVEKEYLDQLEAIKSRFDYIEDIELQNYLTYEDVLELVGHKKAIIRFLNSNIQALIRQRGTNVWNEAELLGWINAIGNLVNIVSNIEKTQQEYEEKQVQKRLENIVKKK